MSFVLEQKPLRVLVVDDEPVGVQRLVRLLCREPTVEVVGTAEHGQEAIDAIRDLRPDLVFLDIHMPGKTGLDVVREVGPADMPATIFVTAYDQYALRAFELAAVDYLVKPYDDERFEQAFRRARRAIELEGRDRVLEKLMAVLQGGAVAPAGPACPACPAPWAPWSTARSCPESRLTAAISTARRARRNASSNRSSSYGFTR